MRFFIRLITALIVILYFSCGAKGPTWEQTLVKQTSAPGSLQAIDSFVLPIMKRYEIPGMSIAVAKDNRLLFAKGYGFADKSKKTETTASSLFRINTISGTITAIAIIKLIEQGKLSMQSTVFGPGGILGNAGARKPYADTINRITIDQLLHHTSGGWSGNDDPVYMQVLKRSSVSRDTLIGLALDNIPLKYNPGDSCSYSSFGYFILGRVIEKITGETYESWVKKNILEPSGIKDMQITGDEEQDKKPGEVSCYLEHNFFSREDDVMDESQYYGRADACTGWIASAGDIARLIGGISADTSALLNKDSRQIMFAASKADPHMACGWYYNQDYKNLYWQTQYPGATAEFVRSYNGYSWVILVNCSRFRLADYMRDIDQIVWNILLKNNMVWPQ